ncbi:calcium-transporting ATPase 11, plasma membrane-type [Dorcoceras hygrometricum]|uniref:Calcium-transporting ATPase 11, plasma membrane-type n=1 Tax=Dorcoceras hygrometricum TaxID=472368 RepID=A0A2Z7CLH4_9LAMI|nr:calcium-transporting ATPase 11, plasma membrane-type [Dorcoceras hygrometricum]
MKRRRARQSADGLALMTSLVMSSQSADGFSIDDVFGDVITISRWFESSSRKNTVHQTPKEKRRRRGGNPVASYCSPADAIWR